MAISIFMELDSAESGTIEGGCDVKGRMGWVECLEMNHNLILPFDKVTGLIQGNRMHSPYQITKATDKASPLLYEHLSRGVKLNTVTLHFYQVIEGKEVEYFTVTLKNAQVVSITPILFNSRDQAYKDMPHLETVQFGYEEISWLATDGNIEYTDNYRMDNA